MVVVEDFLTLANMVEDFRNLVQINLTNNLFKVLVMAIATKLHYDYHNYPNFLIKDYVFDSKY